MNLWKLLSISIVVLVLFSIQGCNTMTGKTAGDKQKITFIELGSVRCIPCQKMQSVMDSIRSNYGDQVKVVFYDIWTPEGKPYGEQYKIHLIPTQVFLDKNGKVYFRHEGYFPFDKVKKILSRQGIK